MRVDVRYDFDVYLRIKEEYHIFAARGALFSDQHTRLMREGVNKLYVRADDWAKIEEYKVSNLSSILTDPGVSAKEKAEVAFSTSMKTIREVFEAAEPRTISSVEKNAEEMVKLILSEDEVMDNLIWINSHDHFTYQHSVRVGIYATALSINLFSEKLSRNELVSLSAGYFLHDIGMAQVPLRILDTRTPLTPADGGSSGCTPCGLRRLLETGISRRRRRPLSFHHERHNGSGYPFAREGDGIPVYAKIAP
jgi:HD-GYP domain-containing protein (c-di-GMP phosphodiesterase class II)